MTTNIETLLDRARRKAGGARSKARVTDGLPAELVTANQRDSTAFARRLIWWPDGLPIGPRIAIVSSRIGRRLADHAAWFDLFRTVCARIDEQDAVLLAGAGTTTAQLAERAAELFDLRSLVIHEPPKSLTIDSWIDELSRTRTCSSVSNPAEDLSLSSAQGKSRARTRRLGSSNPRTFRACLSPRFGNHCGEDSDGPLRDRAVVELADRVYALHVRRNGNLHRLISERLRRESAVLPNVFVALGQPFVPRRLADELLHLGAVGWVLTQDAKDSSSPPRSATAPRKRAETLALARWAQRANLGDFLAHCTRERQGPWPGQAKSDFLDELLTSTSVSRDPLGVLTRMLEHGRLIASSKMIRGQTPVVCFTAAMLAELPDMRTFQPQHAHWDFEPYGLALRRDWLAARGARPVLYGDETMWTNLAEADRPYFQARFSRRRRQLRDWSVEQEWRLVGDLELSLVPDSAAVVFVRTEHEAARIAAVSRWPVVWMQDDGGS